MKRLASGDQQVDTLKYLSRLVGYYKYDKQHHLHSIAADLESRSQEDFHSHSVDALYLIGGRRLQFAARITTWLTPTICLQTSPSPQNRC